MRQRRFHFIHSGTNVHWGNVRVTEMAFVNSVFYYEDSELPDRGV